MLQSHYAPQGMVVTPNHLASESALAILREGGNAIEAMVAAAATVAVAYPHMNGIGGDGFWLIVPREGEPIAIDASGAAGSLATTALYADVPAIPHRGPRAALTVAGTVSGWAEALTIADELHTNPLPLSRLLADAIHYAREGVPVTVSQAAATQSKLAELHQQPGFTETFLPTGCVPEAGTRFRQPALAHTLQTLADDGLASFYRGKLAERIAREMQALQIPVTLDDLQAHHARRCQPLRIDHSCGELFNIPPPTQGAVSLAILGITDTFNMASADEAQTIHRIVEATKLAFGLRDDHITDPAFMSDTLHPHLTRSVFAAQAAKIDEQKAADWGTGKGPGDTVWMGVIDGHGTAVSFIQSIYHEFGSGVVLPETGILWQNRGAAFTLKPDHLLTLAPGKRPFHTLNPAAARLHDGRTLVYGSMGGDGQPQTQATIFTRYVMQNMPLQESITAPRWLLGRTWGQSSDSLKLENRFSAPTCERLQALGHEIEMLPAFSEAVGHAGAIVRHANGMLEGAFDPRSDGSAAGF
ncbi:MAG: Oxamate amidohydrolase proenzyme [Candidatus Erwinia impunctatus]|nr:Oxamate amidohydrolase proenzyme [Culicoides impunctatus]